MNSTESPLIARMTQGTRGLSRVILSYATSRFTPFRTNERSPFAVSQQIQVKRKKYILLFNKSKFSEFKMVETWNKAYMWGFGGMI